MYKNITELVGATPLIHLDKLTADLQLSSRLYGKCEFMNPTGSMKDRIALAMIRAAEADGRLTPGGTIIEPTSGNTGIGLAALGAYLGYRVVLVMPETMSVERRKMMAIYGAELDLTPGAQGMQGAVDRAEALLAETDNAIIAGQFENMANPAYHYRTTGPEIWRDSAGQVDALVAGIGTGGSLSGAGRYLKEQQPSLQVIGVEPDRSPLLSTGQAGPHGLQGIGANFVPGTLDTGVYNALYRATEDEAYAMVRRLARTEGLFCGISSGAALAAAADYAKKHADQDVVVLLPDSGNRYLSSDALFANGV